MSFTATFFKDADGKLKFRTENARDAADPERTYTVEMTYGGGVYKQRYLYRVGDKHYPFLQYNTDGKDEYADRTRKPWRDYHADWLFNEGTKKLADPPKAKSFEMECASCHYTGYTLTPTVGGGFVAGAVNDPNGEADIDGDGMPNELNIGCEVCHGPGSEHAKAPMAKKAATIVNPGQARRRAGHGHLQPVPQPAAGEPEERPAGEQGKPDADPRHQPQRLPGQPHHAGGRRPERLLGRRSPLQGAPPAGDRLHPLEALPQRQADSVLRRLPRRSRQERKSSTSSRWRCATARIRCARRATRRRREVPHAKTVGSRHTKQDQLRRLPHDEDDADRRGLGKGLARKDGKNYWMNDITSHLFDVPRKDNKAVKGVEPGKAMPIPYTNACGRPATRPRRCSAACRSPLRGE